MSTVERALKKDFRAHLEALGWPITKTAKAWMFDHNIKGSGNSQNAAMRQGKPVSIVFVQALISYMLRDKRAGSDDALAPIHWNALRSYLEERCGVVSFESLSLPEIMEHICTPAVKKIKARNLFIDALLIVRDLYHISKALKRQPWKCVKLCNQKKPQLLAKDVTEAVNWMFIVLGRDFGRASHLTDNQARAKAEERLQTDFDDYLQRAIEWCEFDPWTVVRVFDGKQIIGMSIVLPLKQHGYDAIRAGERFTYACRPNEMTHTSAHLVVEACAERMTPDTVSSYQFSRSAVLAIICQEAWLSQIDGIGSNIPLHLLAPAGTVENTRRLKWSGYRPTGTHVFRMPDVDLMERRFSISERKYRRLGDASLLGTWYLLQRDLRSPEAQAWLNGE